MHATREERAIVLLSWMPMGSNLNLMSFKLFPTLHLKVSHISRSRFPLIMFSDFSDHLLDLRFATRNLIQSSKQLQSHIHQYQHYASRVSSSFELFRQTHGADAFKEWLSHSEFSPSCLQNLFQATDDLLEFSGLEHVNATIITHFEEQAQMESEILGDDVRP